MPEIEFTAGEDLEWVLQTAADPPDDEPYTLVRKKLKAKCLELEDVQFHLNSAVLLPDYKDCHEAADDQAAEDRITGLAVVQVCLEQARDNPDKSLLVVGHTDTSGQEEYNLHLSDLRAKAAKAVISGDRGGFAEISASKSKVEDVQRILMWAAAERGWECHPGKVDDETGPKTRAAIRGFQREYNTDFEASIAVDAVVGEKTWGAVFDVYGAAICKLLETDAAGLEAMQKSVVWVSPGAIGAGEKYPIESSRKGDYRAEKNRRVEVLFFDPDEAPKPVQSSGDFGFSQILYDPTQYEYEHLPCEPKTPATLLRAYFELVFLDPDGNSKPFPEGFPVTVKYGNETTQSFFTQEEGKLDFAVRRSGETFTLDFSSEEQKFLTQSAPAEEGGEPPSPSCVDSSALFAIAPTTQYLGFPLTWDLATSKWTIEGADTYNSGEFAFEGLEDVATKIGKPDAPAKLTLEIKWQYFQFVFYDRQAKKLSACPLQLDLRGWLNAADADPDAPDARARWASGQSQVLGWFAQEDPTAETLISMHTEEGTFVKTADDGTQTLEIGLELSEPNVERLRYYDLPQVWRSTGYWARLSAGSPDQEPSKQGVWAGMWDTGTADGTPMMFCLDDLVLTDKNLKPIEWKANGADENRIALFCNTFNDQGTGPGGGTCNSWGVFNPDDELFFYSQDPTDIKDRNYIASYPYWTRLVAAQGNLHECFDQRVPDGEEGPVGARAAVRYINATTIVVSSAVTPQPTTEELMISKPFFALQPHYNQYMPGTRNIQRTISSGGAKCREWASPYALPSGWDIRAGRYDMALLRCCDVVEDKEVAINLMFLRMHYDFSPPAATGWIPTTLAEAKHKPFVSDACENVCARWNAEDGFGDPITFEPVGEGVPLVVTPKWYMQNVPEGKEHFKVAVFDPSPGKRAWMGLTRGVGAITLDGNEGAWAMGRTDVNDTPDQAYVMAHEIGHAAALYDEYNEKWTEYSNNRRSYTSWIPGDPWGMDSVAIMNGNIEPRPRHFWHAAEWCRKAMDDVGLLVKQENSGAAGPAEFKYTLPPHPRAPYRSFVNWPFFSAADVSTDEHSRFQAFLYPAGEDRFAYEVANNTGDPFDGVLSVRVNVRWSFQQEEMPIAFSAVSDLLQAFAVSVHRTFNNKFIATGFKLGEVEFKRCLLQISPCYAVDNVPDDNDEYLNGHTNVAVPTDPTQRTQYLANTLPAQWIQALNGREALHPTDIYVNASDQLEAGTSSWGASTQGRPTLNLSLNDPGEDFYKWFGQMLGLGELPNQNKKWWQKLIPSRDGSVMTDKLTEVILRSITPDGSITKL